MKAKHFLQHSSGGGNSPATGRRGVLGGRMANRIAANTAIDNVRERSRLLILALPIDKSAQNIWPFVASIDG